MAPRPPGGISAELSAAIRALADDPQRAQPPTLEEVRTELQQAGLEWSRNGELLHPEDRTSLLIELDSLISQYGADAAALDFTSGKSQAENKPGGWGG